MANTRDHSNITGMSTSAIKEEMMAASASADSLMDDILSLPAPGAAQILPENVGIFAEKLAPLKSKHKDKYQTAYQKILQSEQYQKIKSTLAEIRTRPDVVAALAERKTHLEKVEVFDALVARLEPIMAGIKVQEQQLEELSTQLKKAFDTYVAGWSGAVKDYSHQIEAASGVNPYYLALEQFCKKQGISDFPKKLAMLSPDKAGQLAMLLALFEEYKNYSLSIDNNYLAIDAIIKTLPSQVEGRDSFLAKIVEQKSYINAIKIIKECSLQDNHLLVNALFNNLVKKEKANLDCSLMDNDALQGLRQIFKKTLANAERNLAQGRMYLSKGQAESIKKLNSLKTPLEKAEANLFKLMNKYLAESAYSREFLSLLGDQIGTITPEVAELSQRFLACYFNEESRVEKIIEKMQSKRKTRDTAELPEQGATKQVYPPCIAFVSVGDVCYVALSTFGSPDKLASKAGENFYPEDSRIFKDAQNVINELNAERGSIRFSLLTDCNVNFNIC